MRRSCPRIGPRGPRQKVRQWQVPMLHAASPRTFWWGGTILDAGFLALVSRSRALNCLRPGSSGGTDTSLVTTLRVRGQAKVVLKRPIVLMSCTSCRIRYLQSRNGRHRPQILTRRHIPKNVGMSPAVLGRPFVGPKGSGNPEGTFCPPPQESSGRPDPHCGHWRHPFARRRRTRSTEWNAPDGSLLNPPRQMDFPCGRGRHKPASETVTK